MASDFTFSFTTADSLPPVATNVIINEVDADTPGADAAEFVELYDGGVGNTPLDGLVVVFYNGIQRSVVRGVRSRRLPYQRQRVLHAWKPWRTWCRFRLQSRERLGLLQNGADAVALFAGNAADFPTGTAVTTTNLQDAIVYDTDDADDSGLLVLLNPGQPQVNENGGGSGDTQSSQRCPNGSGGARNTSTYSQGTPTPGARNTLPASATAEQQHDRHQPAVRRRR